MKYFLHDSNAFNDEKITELFMNFGYEGLGLFYSLLEKLAFHEKPIKTIVLKKQLKVGKRLEKHWKFMEEIGLISSKNGETFNENILNFSENYQIKKEKNRKKISEWREKQQDKKSVTGYVPVRNRPKVKLSKVKLNKVKEIKNNIYGENWKKIEETYQEFKKMRDKIRKPMTELAEIRIIEKLGKLSNKELELAIKILEQSIINSWQDIFKLKSEYKRKESSFD